jgi:hypothetical protein
VLEKGMEDEEHSTGCLFVKCKCFSLLASFHL